MTVLDAEGIFSECGGLASPVSQARRTPLLKALSSQRTPKRFAHIEAGRFTTAAYLSAISPTPLSRVGRAQPELGTKVRRYQFATLGDFSLGRSLASARRRSIFSMVCEIFSFAERPLYRTVPSRAKMVRCGMFSTPYSVLNTS